MAALVAIILVALVIGALAARIGLAGWVGLLAFVCALGADPQDPQGSLICGALASLGVYVLRRAFRGRPWRREMPVADGEAIHAGSVSLGCAHSRWPTDPERHRTDQTAVSEDLFTELLGELTGLMGAHVAIETLGPGARAVHFSVGVLANTLDGFRDRCVGRQIVLCLEGYWGGVILRECDLAAVTRWGSVEVSALEIELVDGVRTRIARTHERAWAESA